MKYIVFTDLDGTLIDHNTYSYESAIISLNLLKEHNIPLIFCTSKTRTEIEIYEKKLNFKCPFISENGGGIFIPSDYFNIEYEYTKKVGAYNVIELGTNYDIIRDILKKIRTELNINIIGFGDLSIKELKADTGLDMESARCAKIREYDEAFKIDSRDKNIEKKVSKLIKYHGFNYTKGGRYWHIMGDNDKGMAVKKLTDLYKKEYDNVKTIGIGDSLNDLPMLQSVDIPLLVQKYNGTHDININEEQIIKIKGIGPIGWNWAIKKILFSKIQ